METISDVDIKHQLTIPQLTFINVLDVTFVFFPLADMYGKQHYYLFDVSSHPTWAPGPFHVGNRSV
jgi:hypothetical protein